MKVRTGFLLGVVALGFWGLVLLRRSHRPSHPTEANAELLECRLHPGEDLPFRLHSITDTGAGDATQHLELEAVLHWRVLASRGTGWLVAAALDGLTVAQGPVAPTPEIQAALAEPFLVEVGRDCRFKGFAFAPRSDARARSRIEALMRTMEIVLPVAPVRQWTARQDDALGSYQGHYQRETTSGNTSGGTAGAVISRRRVRYHAFRLPSLGPKLAGPSAEIVSSEARATLDTEGGWLSALSSQDHLELSLGGRLLARVSGSIELRRIEAPPLPRLVGLAIERFVSRSSLQAEEGPPELTVPDTAHAALDLSGALSDFERRLGSGKGGLHDAVATLAGYLALKPGAIGELMVGLRDGARKGSIDPKLHSALFLALERTGTPEAERALAEGVGDRRLSSVDRMRAAVALADVPHPSQQAVGALVTQARSRGGDAEAQDVSRSALLALGTLDHNTATSNPELATKARQELGARLRAGPPSDEVMTDLDAVGNSGDESLVAAVERYTDDPSPLVRAHAAGAFGRTMDAADEARLTAWLVREPDRGVRRAIVATLAERVDAAGGGLSSNLLSTAISWLPQETDAQVRGLLIRLLGGVAASVEEAKQALVDQFHRERQPELIELIGHYCSVDELR
jgi:HEAT repeat protein